MRIAVTGASGLVGTRLCWSLRERGHDVRPVVRRRASGNEIFWNEAAQEMEAPAFEGLDAVIHLAGESVAAGRWSAERKRLILESRTHGTRLLARTLARLRKPPGVLVSASAIGYYGDTGDVLVEEDAAPGAGFLARVVREWEAAADPAREAGLRVVHPRIGVVLAAAGGALGTLLTPFRLGLGGVVGSGRQYLSWIALDDLVAALAHLLEAEVFGPINATAPGPVTNAEFTGVLGGVLGRPTVLPLPALVIRALFGEMGREMMLAGQRVSSKRLEDSGFSFRFPALAPALRHELDREQR